MTDYEKNYDEFWKAIIEGTGPQEGLVDMDKLQRELFDYHTLMKNAGQVYCHVTDNRISKLNTDHAAVCAVADDVFNARFAQEIEGLSAQPVPVDIAEKIAEVEARRIDIAVDVALSFMVGDMACAAYFPRVDCGLSGFSGRMVVLADPMHVGHSYVYIEQDGAWVFCDPLAGTAQPIPLT